MQTPPDKLIREKELPNYGVHYGHSWLPELEKQGKFPKRIKLAGKPGSTGSVAWLESEIVQWIKDRAAERDAPPAAQPRALAGAAA